METAEDRSARLQREANAKKISDSIDEAIKQDRERYRKSKEDVKVSAYSRYLLLCDVGPRQPRAFAPATVATRGTLCYSGYHTV